MTTANKSPVENISYNKYLPDKCIARDKHFSSSYILYLFILH